MSRKMLYLCVGLLVLLFLKGVLPSTLNPPPQPNLATLQAEAFLHGTLDIGREAPDAALFQGRYFVVFPPFPSVLLMPFVWAFGVAHTNVVLISLLLTVLNVWVLYRILRGQQVDLDTTLWMMIAFFMGTAYWMTVKGSFGVWHFAHVVCVTAMLLAINEALGNGRGWLVGLYLAMAILSRHMAVYALPFLAWALWSNKREMRALFGMAACVAAALAPYFWMNWTRFDHPFDLGYTYIVQSGYLKERLETSGLFHIDYFPFNFIHLFLQGFHVQFDGSALLHLHCLDPFGTSLTFASPFVFAAFWARWKKGLLISAWISIALMLIHTLFYFTNGYYQINAQRFTLDFLPLLIILAALGAQRCNPKVWKPLIAYSVILNIVASAVCAFSS